MKTIEVPERELAHMLLGAFRYSLGRATYITSYTADWLIKYWAILPSQWQRQIQDDISNAIERDRAGMSCDLAEWRRVLSLPLSESNPSQRGVPVT
jgi:hypothetical protein